MSRMLVVIACFLSIAGLTIAPPLAGGQEEKQTEVAKVTTPADGTEVEQIDLVEAKLTNKSAGWPVVLVRPIIGGQPWYAQEVVEDLAAEGSFSVEAYFGDDETKPGTKFRVMIVIVADKETAHTKYKANSTHSNQKLGKLPKSKQVGVTRK